MNNKIISFDFDGTIDHHFGDLALNPYKESIREWFKILKDKGYNIYIITRRFGPDHSEHGMKNEHIKPFEFADEVGLNHEKVIFTNRGWKFKTIRKIGGFLHIDDDIEEINFLEKELPDVKRIWLGNKEWLEDLKKALE